MVYQIDYLEQNFIADYKSYFNYQRKKSRIQLILLAGISIISFLLTIEDIINLMAMSMGIGALTVLSAVYEFIIHVTATRSITKASKSIEYGKGFVKTKANEVEFLLGNITQEVVFHSQIRQCLILNEVIFLELNSKNSWPSRINKFEIGNIGFKDLLKELQGKNIKIKLIK